MSTRIEAAAALGISERTLRRYLREFSPFFSSDRDLTGSDLELLKVIHVGKKTGQDTGQEIRDRLMAFIRETATGPARLTDTSASVQKETEPQAQRATASGQAEVTGQNAAPVTQEDLLALMMPLVALVQSLRADVQKLSTRLEQPRPALPAATPSRPALRQWRPMPLPAPPASPKPRAVAWWRLLLHPELQRNGS